MFINYTNHISANWNDKQLNEARKYGEIADISFPAVDPLATRDEIISLAIKEANKIIEMAPNAVLIQGEMTLTYNIILILKENNIKTLCACSERIVKEIIQDDKTSKQSIFQFVKFREY